MSDHRARTLATWAYMMLSWYATVYTMGTTTDDTVFYVSALCCAALSPLVLVLTVTVFSLK